MHAASSEAYDALVRSSGKTRAEYEEGLAHAVRRSEEAGPSETTMHMRMALDRHRELAAHERSVKAHKRSSGSALKKARLHSIANNGRGPGRYIIGSSVLSPE